MVMTSCDLNEKKRRLNAFASNNELVRCDKPISFLCGQQLSLTLKLVINTECILL